MEPAEKLADQHLKRIRQVLEARGATEDEIKRVEFHCLATVKLADQHWQHTRQALETHGAAEDEIARIGFHYLTAFVHGYKHGMEAVAAYQDRRGGRWKILTEHSSLSVNR